MASTQEFLPIENIKDDILILKDGSVAMIIQTSAVNFDLLSETEQMAIIGSFAGLLNSLSFSIQIVISSKKLDISAYLKVLKAAEDIQKSPLLKMMMQRYRAFVSNIIRDNEVLDKQFYVVISVSYLETGFTRGNDKSYQKAITLLIPRRDHVIRQLGRIGLKSNQLTTDKMIKLFYEAYNESNVLSPEEKLKLTEKELQGQSSQAPGTATPPPQPQTPPAPAPDQNPPIPAAFQKAVKETPLVNREPQAPVPQTPPPAPSPQSTIPVQTKPNVQSLPDLNAGLTGVAPKPITDYNPRQVSSRVPFVSEELPDEYGTT